MATVYPTRLRTALDVDPEPAPAGIFDPLRARRIRNSASAIALDGALRSAQPVTELVVNGRR